MMLSFRNGTSSSVMRLTRVRNFALRDAPFERDLIVWLDTPPPIVARLLVNPLTFTNVVWLEARDE